MGRVKPDGFDLSGEVFFRWGMIKFFRWSKPLFTTVIWSSSSSGVLSSSYPSSESESSSSISGNISQSLKHSRCLEKTSYHSPELQDQSGHGKLRIDRLRRRVRDCLKVLYRGSRYCVVSWLDLGILIGFSEVYLGTFNIRGVVFPEAFEDR